MTSHEQPPTRYERSTVSYVRHVQVRGFDVPVSIREEGSGAVPLLMLHGVGTELERWGRFREVLGRATIAFDVKGPHLGRIPSMRTYARFISAVLDEMDVRRVDVLGLSWGGIAAQQLAHDHPSWVRRIVLAGTTPGFISMPARPSSMAAVISPHRDPERMNMLIQRLYRGDFLDNPGLAHELNLVRPIDEKTYRRQMTAVLGWTSVPWLPSIRHKALILHGDDDPVVPAVNARLMNRLIQDSQLKIIEGGGHLFIMTRPEETGRTVRQFLDRPDRAKGRLTSRMEDQVIAMEGREAS